MYRQKRREIALIHAIPHSDCRAQDNRHNFCENNVAPNVTRIHKHILTFDRSLHSYVGRDVKKQSSKIHRQKVNNSTPLSPP